jgi:hypothetical protein
LILDESPITGVQLNKLFENQGLRNLKILLARNNKNLRNTEIVGPLNDFRDKFYKRKEYMNLEVLDITGCKWYGYNLKKSRRFFETTILIGVLNFHRKEEVSEEKKLPQLLDPIITNHDATTFIPLLKLKPSPLNI